MKFLQYIKLAMASAALFSLSVLAVSALTAKTVAAASPIQAEPKVTFTFDDGLNSAYQYAAPILQKAGYQATEYIPTSCIGTVGSCPENANASYMNWTQVQTLKDTYGWEVASHSANTPCLASNSPGCPNKSLLTSAQISQELSSSQQVLAAHGFNATAFATPYGDYNNVVLKLIAKYYTSHRGFADKGYNRFPYNDYLLYDQYVTGGVSAATVESYINTAITNKEWLVLTFHDVLPKASNNPSNYQWSTTNLQTIVNYIKSKNIKVTTISDGLATSSVNLLSNGSFDNGLTGWSTDNSNSFSLDTNNNGAMPSPASSIAITAGTTQAHLFSPKVSITAGENYVIKSYLDVEKISSGEVGYYIDEYDNNGNWISGQWKTAERSSFVEDMNFEYVPSSQSVKSASLQIYVTANSGIQAYIDSFQWFPENNTVTQPANLLPNYGFIDGIADGWSTDAPASVTADNSGNGQAPNAQTSIKFVATTKDSHLFSPKVAVSSTSSYTITSYLNLSQISSGVFGYYIDEYDASGNWISGQYKKDFAGAIQTNVNLNYVPSSANVKYASLQFIDVANSASIAYVDNAVWYAN